MTYIDTHCHLDSILAKTSCPSFAELRQLHFPPEFEACITISCDPNSVEPVRELAREEGVFAAFGIHPHDAKHYGDDLETRITYTMTEPKTVAWGEIGLDYHYNFSDPDCQRRVFIRQIEMALSCGKPLIIHTREAESDTLDIMKTRIPLDWPIHVHCFTGTMGLAGPLLEHFSRLYLGFTGIITFKNALEVQSVVRETPLHRMVLETDGPYLAPVPFRGKPAHPGHIPWIARKIAELKAMEEGAVYARIRENTRALYGV